MGPVGDTDRVTHIVDRCPAVAPVGIAFCGCGAISRRHARVLTTLGERIVACWNPPGHQSSADALASDTGSAYATDDLDRIAADPAVGAVYVCTWQHQRVDVLETLAAAGKPVLMEKPLAATPADLGRMADILRRHPVHFQAGYKTRFNSAVVDALRRLPQAEVVMAQILDAAWPTGSRGADPLVGGGHIRSQGVYGFEVVRLMSGSRPVAVAAVGAAGGGGGGGAGSIAASVEFESGAVASVLVSDAATSSPASKFTVTAAGGGVTVSLTDRFTTLVHRSAGVEEVVRHREDGFRRQTIAFLRDLRAGSPSSCTFDDGALASDMVFAAIESCRSGQRVEIVDRSAAPSGDPGKI